MQYDVVEARTVEDGLRALETEKPGVILLDFTLPEFNNTDVLGKIRNMIPRGALIMTPCRSMEFALEAICNGLLDFVELFPEAYGGIKRENNLKYRVKEGKVYLVEEKRLDRGADIFIDLLNSGYSGIIISRRRPDEIKDVCMIDAPILWLSEDVRDKRAVYPELRSLEKIISNYAVKGSVVLLDRLDYLVVRASFREVLGFIQRLNELFYFGKGILIITMDPDILSPQEHSLLEKETSEAKLRVAPKLPADLWEILNYVRQQNIRGVKPSQKEIVERFNITRTTARKRIRNLSSLGLMMYEKKGRHKVWKLTESGVAFCDTHT